MKKITSFAIEAGKTTKLDIILGAVAPVRIQVTIMPTQDKVSANQTIYHIDNKNHRKEITEMCWYDKKSQSCTINLPVGTYLLQTTYKEITKETPFEVKNIAENFVNVIMNLNADK